MKFRFRLPGKTRWVAWALMLLGMLGLSSCRSVETPGPRLGVREACDAGITYQGRSYAGEAAYGLLGIQASSDVHAVRQVSDTLQLYLQQCAMLCEERERGSLQPAEYMARRDALTERFLQLAQFTKQLPPAQIEETDSAMYGETLAVFKPTGVLQPLTAQMEAFHADGSRLADGASLASGESFSINVTLARPAHLYLLIQDSSGGLYKLYPSDAAGGSNPASGRIRIPQQGMLTLDDVPGMETIYLFAGSPSPSLESGLEEIGTNPKSSKAQSVLASAVRFRGVFVNTKENVPSGGISIEALGQAAATFTIEHR